MILHFTILYSYFSSFFGHLLDLLSVVTRTNLRNQSLMRHSIILFVSLLFLAAIGQAQVNPLSQANKLYSLKAYSLAITEYKAALKTDPDNAFTQGKLAECYLLTNQADKAVAHYQRLQSLGYHEPIQLLNHGHALKMLGRYADARQRYLAYTSENSAIASHYAESCDFAEQLNDAGVRFYTVKKEWMNSAEAEFAPAYIDNQVVFASSRKQKQTDTDWTGNNSNQLYVSSQNDKGQLTAAQPLRDGIETVLNQAPISVAKNAQRVAYTKNSKITGNRPGSTTEKEASLYLADLASKQKWTSEEAFSFNSASGDYLVSYPHLSDNGMVLYFASTMPGGYGGYDLYVSYKNGSTWSAPINLGPQINSIGDEISPFFQEESGLLFFASDYHLGLGGFDMFSSKGESSTWSTPENLGTGINSFSDDYGLIAQHNSGYFVSNRMGGKGQEDIYRFEGLSKTMIVTVLDEYTRLPIQGASINMSDCSKGSYSTNVQGKSPGISLSTACAASITKDGYLSSTVMLSPSGKDLKKYVTVKLSPKDVVQPLALVEDKPAPTRGLTPKGIPSSTIPTSDLVQIGQHVKNQMDKPVANAKVHAYEQGTDKKIGTYITDHNGYVQIDAPKNSTIKLTFVAKGYRTGNKSVSLYSDNLYVASHFILYPDRAPAPSISDITISEPAKPQQVIAASPPALPAPTPSSAREEVSSNVSTYLIQIGAFKSPDYEKLDKLKEIGPMQVDRLDNGITRVSISGFATREAAERGALEAKKVGYLGAFVKTNKLTSKGPATIPMGEVAPQNTPIATPPAPSTVPAAPILTTTSNVYTVSKGDTLYGISRKFDVSIEDLKKWNQLTSNDLSIGQKLIFK